MNAESLLALYERVADAPNAIPRLRRFVLDLAVRGRLVSQLAEECGPQERDLHANDRPFGVPSSWRWMRIGDQLDLLNGVAFRPSDWRESGVKIVRIQNLNNPSAPFNHCDPEVARERSLIDDGSFLISWSGTPGTSFGAFIWKRGPAVLNQHIFRCDFRTNLFVPEFLRLAVNGRLDEMIAKAQGGVGLQHITKGKLEALLVPLPSFGEQHRIVAKVDELMALLDRLEAARSKREATRDRLTTATLARLTAADVDPESLRSRARFALDALPALTTRADQIKQLRRTIIDLAVRGRLSEQRAADRPASVLLSQMNEQRASAGVGEPKSAPKPSDVPFPIPPGWELSRLGDVCSKTGSGSTPRGGREVYQVSGIPFLRSQNIYNDGLRLDDVAYIDELTHKKMAGTRVQGGDLLLNITGGSIGRCAQVPKSFGNANISQHVAIIRPAVPEIQRFLHCLILSPYFQSFVVGEQTGAGRGGLPKNRMDRIVVPIPPIEEQHRIVAMVDDLMSICDRMESALQVADRTRMRLLEALLHDALSSDSTERKAA